MRQFVLRRNRAHDSVALLGHLELTEFDCVEELVHGLRRPIHFQEFLHFLFFASVKQEDVS